MIDSVNILVVGKRKQGKSTYVKAQVLHGKQFAFVYDPNGEYGIHGFRDKAGRPVENEDRFIEEAFRRKGHIIVFEEATAFFREKGNHRTMSHVLTRSRHMENFIVMVFHSLRSVPSFILDNIDYIVLFKTNDSQRSVEARFKDFPMLVEGWDRLREMPDGSYIEIEL